MVVVVVVVGVGVVGVVGVGVVGVVVVVGVVGGVVVVGVVVGAAAAAGVVVYMYYCYCIRVITSITAYCIVATDFGDRPPSENQTVLHTCRSCNLQISSSTSNMSIPNQSFGIVTHTREWGKCE